MELLGQDPKVEFTPSSLREVVAVLPESKFDGFMFRQVSALTLLPGVLHLGRWILYIPRIEKLHYVAIADGFDAYLSRRSAKSRYNIKRATQRLQSMEEASIFEVITEPIDMARFQNIACSISTETYQGKLLDAGFPASPEYLASMTDLAKKGRARAYLLKEKGVPIAFAWCTSQDRELTYQIIGYLPSRAALSPGTVLLTLILEDVFRCGRYDRFDFGVGDAPYKASFATHVIELADIYIFHATWRAALLVRLLMKTDSLSSALGKMLERWGLKRRIKMLLRRVRGVGL